MTTLDREPTSLDRTRLSAFGTIPLQDYLLMVERRSNGRSLVRALRPIFAGILSGLGLLALLFAWSKGSDPVMAVGGALGVTCSWGLALSLLVTR